MPTPKKLKVNGTAPVEELDPEIADQLIEAAYDGPAPAVTLPAPDPAKAAVERTLKTYYTFRDGTEVKLRGVPPLLLQGAQSTFDRPEPPKRKVVMAGGGVMEVERGDQEAVLAEEEIDALADPKKQAEEREYRRYRYDLAQWQINVENRLSRIIFLMGVESDPPDDQVRLMKLLGFHQPEEIKCMWLASKLWTAEEISDFFEAVASVTVPTEAGIEEAEKMFQSALARGQGVVAKPG